MGSLKSYSYVLGYFKYLLMDLLNIAVFVTLSVFELEICSLNQNGIKFENKLIGTVFCMLVRLSPTSKTSTTSSVLLEPSVPWRTEQCRIPLGSYYRWLHVFDSVCTHIVSNLYSTTLSRPLRHPQSSYTLSFSTNI